MHHPTAPIGHWYKSSYSASQGDCVEVADMGDGAALRDTMHRDLGTLNFARVEWQVFLAGVKRVVAD